MQCGRSLPQLQMAQCTSVRVSWVFPYEGLSFPAIPCCQSSMECTWMRSAPSFSAEPPCGQLWHHHEWRTDQRVSFLGLVGRSF